MTLSNELKTLAHTLNLSASIGHFPEEELDGFGVGVWVGVSVGVGVGV